MAERDNTARLYEALKGEGYTDLGTLSEFEGSLKDSGKREHVYTVLSENGYSDLGDFKQFETKLGYGEDTDNFFGDFGERLAAGAGRLVGSSTNLLKKITTPVESAVDWANELEPIAASVTVVHRRDEFGGHEKSVLKMRDSSVCLKTPYEVVQLHGDGELIQSVSIENKDTGKIERIELDAIIVNHGLKCDYGALEKWGLNIEDGVAIVNEKRETNIEGIYGAGDFVDHPSKVRYIAGAFTDGILALNSAKLYLEPDAPKVAYVSSHNIRFKERNKKIGLVDNDYREVRG